MKERLPVAMERHPLHTAGGIEAAHRARGAAAVGGFLAPHLAIGPAMAAAAFVHRALALQAAFAVEHAFLADVPAIAQLLLSLDMARVLFAAAHEPGLPGRFGTVGDVDGLAIQSQRIMASALVM
jgi:hypothetical protein